MKLQGKAKLLRIFVGSCDKVNGTPLYEFIVFSAKRYGLAGATVLRGTMGYGANSIIRSAKFLSISEDLPIIIEIIDESEKINRFLSTIDKYLDNATFGCLITSEVIDVIAYKPAKKKDG